MQKYKYTGNSLSADQQKNYDKDLVDSYVSEINKLVAGSGNREGTKTVKAVAAGDVVTSDPKNWAFRLVSEDVKHEDFSYVVEVITNSDGTAKGLKVLDTDLAQSAIDNILSHYGVRGMRWGVRRK